MVTSRCGQMQPKEGCVSRHCLQGELGGWCGCGDIDTSGRTVGFVDEILYSNSRNLILGLVFPPLVFMFIFWPCHSAWENSVLQPGTEPGPSTGKVQSPNQWLLSSRSSVSDSLQPHGPQHTRLSCPSLSPGVCSNSSIESIMPANYLILCHSLLLMRSIFPSIRVFPKSWLFTSGGQSIGASPSAAVLPMNSGLISLKSKGSQVSSPASQFKS